MNNYYLTSCLFLIARYESKDGRSKNNFEFYPNNKNHYPDNKSRTVSLTYAIYLYKKINKNKILGTLDTYFI